MKKIIRIAIGYMALVALIALTSKLLHLSFDRLMQLNILWWVMAISYQQKKL